MHSVLLIEDDDILVMQYAEMLQELGFKKNNIASVLNGREALALVTNNLPHQPLADLILLDLKMPVMDGFGFLEAYSKLPNSKNTRIIIISSSIDPDELDRAAAFGAYLYITKPLQKEVLEGMLRQNSRPV